jgi:hypothetical protein
MRSFLTLGCISLVTVAAFVACGDDSNGPTGTAGTAGAGGGAGAAGSAGAGGGAGSGGSSGTGSGGTAGTGSVTPPPPTNCTGCLQLTVPIPATPIDTANSRTAVQAAFTTGPTAAAYDLTNVTAITWRIQVLTPDANFFIQPFVQDGPPEDPGYLYSASSPALIPLTATAFPAGSFANVTLDIAALGGGTAGADAGADGGADSGAVDAGVVADAGDGGVQTLTAFDKSKVRIIGINVGGLAAAAGQQVSIEIDSVTVEGTSNFTAKTFDTTVEGLTLNTYYNFPPGSTLTTH